MTSIEKHSGVTIKLVACVLLFATATPLQADLYTFEGEITSISDSGGVAGGYTVGDTFSYQILIDFDERAYVANPDGSTDYMDDGSPWPGYERDYFWADISHTLMVGDYQNSDGHYGMDQTTVFNGVSDYMGTLGVGDGGFDSLVEIRKQGETEEAWVKNWAAGDTFEGIDWAWCTSDTGGLTHSLIKSDLTLMSIDREATQYSVAPVPVPGAALLGVLGLGTAGVKLRRRFP